MLRKSDAAKLRVTPELDGDERRPGGRRQHGRLAGKQHQHLHQCRGAQLASDLGKGLIQGTSQYIAKKMRTVKVHLKAGYRVMLYQEKD